MLPFLKDRHEGANSGTVDLSIKREPDDGGDEYGMLDAVAEDIMDAVQKKDKALLKGALEALIEHIQSEDEIQDHSEE